MADTLTPTVKNKATLNVTKAADITTDEVDIVTGADSWDGFGGGTDGGTTEVRVDQSSIRIDFKADANDKNSTVTLDLTGTGITFGGKSIDHRLDGARRERRGLDHHHPRRRHGPGG